MMRVFLGLEPPDEIRRLLEVQQFLLPLPRRVAPETLHLTLRFFGELPDEQVTAVHEALTGIRAAPFTLLLRGFGLFGGSRPRAAFAAVEPSAPLDALQARTEAAARRAGCELEHRRFVPHVTLGRFPPPPAPEAMRLERAIAETAFIAPPWPVEEMVLWQSVAARGGRRYDELARYPLGSD